MALSSLAPVGCARPGSKAACKVKFITFYIKYVCFKFYNPLKVIKVMSSLSIKDKDKNMEALFNIDNLYQTTLALYSYYCDISNIINTYVPDILYLPSTILFMRALARETIIMFLVWHSP